MPARELAKRVRAARPARHAPARVRLRRLLGASPTAWPAWSSRPATPGVRSLVSVQGSLAMFAIWRFGSEEQKQQWLPGMAAGDAIGCFGLTEPDHGSDPASMKTRAERDGDDWILHGTKMWITNAPVADVAVVWARTDDGHRAGFVVPMDTPGRDRERDPPQAVAARLVDRRDRARRGAAARRRPSCRRRSGCKAPLSLPDRGPVRHRWGALGAARDCLETAIAYSRRPGSSSASRSPASSSPRPSWPTWRVELQKGYLLALHLAGWPTPAQLRPEQVSVGKLNNVREAIAIARTCRTILGANGISLRVPGAAPRQQPGERADLRGHLRGAPARHRPAADRHRRLLLSAAAELTMTKAAPDRVDHDVNFMIDTL